jgi:DNA-binding transcriptional ArsR family regulator
VLRIRFTAADLLETAFVAAPGPVLETSLAIMQLQRRDGGPAYDQWRRQQLAALERPALAMLELVRGGNSASFLDQVSPDLSDGLAAMRDEPLAGTAAELRALVPARPNAFIRGVAAGEAQAWQTVDRAVQTAHAGLVEPCWDRLYAAFRADIAYRSQLMASSGLRAALASVCPGSTWSGSVWEIDRPGRDDFEIDLGGRGLLLTPSCAWSGPPLRTCVTRRPLLIYSGLGALPALLEPPRDDPLAVVVGRTRAAVLRELATPRGTTELAARLRISPAAASEHAAALRRVGLVATERLGRSVRHRCTGLGDQLLAGAAVFAAGHELDG